MNNHNLHSQAKHSLFFFKLVDNSPPIFIALTWTKYNWNTTASIEKFTE